MTTSASDWFADETFWQAIAPFVFSEGAQATAVADVAAITALAGRPAASVLDLCCGPGRHSVAFARAGSQVTGVDRSPFLLGRARQYASASGVDIRWMQQDMREFVEANAFELAVNLFTSFGYFDDPAENQRVLANVHASLVPGGVFVIELMGKEIVARIYQPCSSMELPDGALLVQRRKVIDDWARVENDWSVIRDGKVQAFRFRNWLYSAVELRELLKSAGFTTVDVFGNLDGAPYGVEANRLVARARKAG